MAACPLQGDACYGVQPRSPNRHRRLTILCPLICSVATVARPVGVRSTSRVKSSLHTKCSAQRRLRGLKRGTRVRLKGPVSSTLLYL